MNYDKIHIFGASGSGTTTLAKALCAVSSYVHFDSDDYFWKIKYSLPWPREMRLQTLEAALQKERAWILSGAVIDWGNPLIPLFDAVIFLSVPNEERISRLMDREKRRYGSETEQGGARHREFTEFIDWAKLYEAGGMDVRSRLQQETWLETIRCPVLRIEGAQPVEETYEIAREFLLG